MPNYSKIIEQDNETLRLMRRANKEWRTIVVGLPIIRKLLNGEDVNLESLKISLIHDDVLFNAKPHKKP